MRGCRIVGAFVFLTTLASCYSKTCIPSDTTCWPCTAAGTTNPGCLAPLQDDKKPHAKTCYRMTMGCDDIIWNTKPEADGSYKGKCVQADSTPHEIPCADAPTPDGGVK